MRQRTELSNAGVRQMTLDAAACARAVRSDLAAQQKAVEVATEAYAKDKASRVG